MSALFSESTYYQQLIAELRSPHVPGEKLLTKLSFTHIKQLLPIDDPLKRTFYEVEAIKGTWSVRELKRQISSLYFERSGLSDDPDALARLTQDKIGLPPVGILLVAEKKNPLVEYATAGMDENLFVKTYLLQLPDKATLENFLNQELNRL